MENSFKNLIEASKSILILLPTKPYFDQVAAGLALFLALKDQKDVQVYSPTPMTVEFNRIVGVNKVSDKLGNKNLIIRFVDYKAADIERVSYDIEDGQFRLTVIPKQKITPPTKEQIELSYSGVSADTVIMIGGANETHFPAIAGRELSSANMVHIGTRDISLSSNKSYVSFSRPASSVSEVVASLIKESGLLMNEDCATNLLMGIENATSNLSDPSVTPETFLIISELMRSGGKRLSSQPIQRTQFPAGSIPARPQRTYQQPQVVSAQSQPQAVSTQTQVEPAKTQTQSETEEPPKDWLQPKIYKGTSVS